jgi:hypothetical protein
MIGRRTLAAALLAALLARSAAAAEFTELAPGQLVAGQIGFSAERGSRIEVPLPSGRWEVVHTSVEDQFANANSSITVGLTRVGTIVLFRTDGPTVASTMVVSATLTRPQLSTNVSNWRDDGCRPATPPLLRDLAGSSARDPRCVVVWHQPAFAVAASGTAAGDAARQYVARKRLSMPATAIVSHVFSATPTRFVAVTLSHNPALAGLDIDERDPAVNPFAPGMIDADRDRRAFADRVVRWTRGYAEIVFAGFVAPGGLPSAGYPALPPSPAPAPAPAPAGVQGDAG